MFVGTGPCEEELTNPVPQWWHDNLIYTNERLALFEDIARKACRQNQITYVPIFDVMKNKIEQGKKLLIDGLHPNDAGHELIFKLVQPELDKLLANEFFN